MPNGAWKHTTHAHRMVRIKPHSQGAVFYAQAAALFINFLLINPINNNAAQHQRH